jgi:hypothetical protein
LKKNASIVLTARPSSHRNAMPIHTTDIAFDIRDQPTLLFIEHCMEHWKDLDVCTDAHVAFMKHLMRTIFGLPHYMELVGIRFEDRTLSMLSPPSYHTFFALTLGDHGVWKAAHVHIEGFEPYWGMEAGFWDGLAMAEGMLMGMENAGPKEEAG